MRALILLFVLLVSCNASRQLTRSDQSESANSGREELTVRPGDTVSWTSPNVTRGPIAVFDPAINSWTVRDTTLYRYHFKDTTITRVSKNNTVLQVKYDSTGQVARVDCITPELLQYLKEWNNFQKEDNQKEVAATMRTIDWFYLAAIVAIFLLLLIKLPSLRVK